MAATTIKPYPHVQINVKDNSIASIDFRETLPVHRPLYVMRTEKGPLGDPVWCNTYSEAAALFGAETFNPANKLYFSRQSLFLRNTLTRNGAFIARYLPSGNKIASCMLFAYVTKDSAITQYKYDENTGYRVQKYDENAEEFVNVPKDTPAEGIKVEYFVRELTNEEIDDPSTIVNVPTQLNDGWVFPLMVYTASDSGAYGNDIGFELFYTPRSNDAGDVKYYKTLFFNIGFLQREYNSTTWNPIVDIYNRENVAFAVNPEAINPDTGASMSIDYVLDKSFSDTLHQLPVNFQVFESNFNEIGLLIASFEDDITTKSGNLIAKSLNNYVSDYVGALHTKTKDAIKARYFGDGSIDDVEDAFDTTGDDPAFGYMVNMVSCKNLINVEYDHAYIETDNPTPMTDQTSLVPTSDKVADTSKTYYVKVTDPVTRKTAKVALDSSNEFVTYACKKSKDLEYDDEKTYYIKEGSETDFVFKPVDDESIFNLEDGKFFDKGVYRVSGTTPYDIETAVVYELSKKISWTTDDVKYESVTIKTDSAQLLKSYEIALRGGKDGTFYESVYSGTTPTSTPSIQVYTNEVQSSDDEAMYEFCKLRLPGLKDKIVESLRYPFTHIFDVGYTMKTKKAILDFLDVRDDFAAIMTTQVLYSDGTGRKIEINDQATDEANGADIRSYALLMRESILFGTDCMRASIYCHAGQLADSVYTGVVPFTFWVAEQYSKYGNMTYMSREEPRGLPNSYNLLFKSWNWNNYRADAQSRVWDSGLNYVQYADMSRLFYPSLRTVYRAATSVLVDEWVVASVIYAKYVCRRAWARFSGRNDYAAALQGMIKSYIDSELNQLFNGKYTFETSVYQTAEEQELGYIQHVKLSITYGATMRVLDVDIEVNREGFTPEE